MSEELSVRSKLGSTSHGNPNSATCWLDGLGQTEENGHRDPKELKSKKAGKWTRQGKVTSTHD